MPDDLSILTFMQKIIKKKNRDFSNWLNNSETERNAYQINQILLNLHLVILINKKVEKLSFGLRIRNCDQGNNFV